MMRKRGRDWEDQVDGREKVESDHDEKSKDESDDDEKIDYNGAPKQQCPLCHSKGSCKKPRKSFYGLFNWTETLDCPLCEGKKYFYARPKPCIFKNCVNGFVTRDKDPYGKEEEKIRCPLCQGLQYTLKKYEKCLSCDGCGRDNLIIPHWFWTEKKHVVCKTCNGLGAFSKASVVDDAKTDGGAHERTNITSTVRTPNQKAVLPVTTPKSEKPPEDAPSTMGSSLKTYAMGAVTGLAVGCAFSPELILPTVLTGAALVMATKDEISKKLFSEPSENSN